MAAGTLLYTEFPETPPTNNNTADNIRLFYISRTPHQGQRFSSPRSQEELLLLSYRFFSIAYFFNFFHQSHGCFGSSPATTTAAFLLLPLLRYTLQRHSIIPISGSILHFSSLHRTLKTRAAFTNHTRVEACNYNRRDLSSASSGSPTNHRRREG